MRIFTLVASTPQATVRTNAPCVEVCPQPQRVPLPALLLRPLLQATGVPGEPAPANVHNSNALDRARTSPMLKLFIAQFLNCSASRGCYSRTMPALRAASYVHGTSGRDVPSADQPTRHERFVRGAAPEALYNYAPSAARGSKDGMADFTRLGLQSVPLWAPTTQILSCLSFKRDCSIKNALAGGAGTSPPPCTIWG